MAPLSAQTSRQQHLLPSLLLLASACAVAGGEDVGTYIESALAAAARAGQPPPILSPEFSLSDLGLPENKGAAEGLPLPRPKLADSWSCSLRYTGSMMGMNFKDGRGKFYTDRPGKKYRMTYEVTSDYFTHGRKLLLDQLTVSPHVNTTLGTGGDSVCMSVGAMYTDMWAWVKLARQSGHKVVRGEPCNVWTFNSTSAGYVASVCLAKDGVPREFVQVLGKKGSKWSGRSEMNFSDVVVGPPPSTIFEPSEACAKNYPTRPCNNTRVSTISVYRIFGSPEPLELQNRDTGDILGDLSFVCTQGSGEAYRSKLITHWRVNVSLAFGQYAVCNFNGTANDCLGDPAMLKSVGRRSGQMQGSGPLLGQCSPNDDVGSQYSFPTAAMCPPGVSPGRDVCAWGGAVSVRTVAASCVMEDRGLLQACTRDIGKAPFTDAENVWKAAFASEDPEKGGCPEVPYPPSSRLVVV
uniref:Uncharacterized protein n=1 Tax=Alexandrium monilatum TaxID=311494 RepID=A0A7S4T8T1_9DINO